VSAPPPSPVNQWIASGEIWVYGWVFAISIWAGIVNVYRQHKSGTAPRHTTIFEWIGECSTSGFVGLLVFLLCRWAGLNDFLGAAFTGIAAHMGTRALPLMEDVLTNWLGRIGGKK
jgi:hypothetical protein